MERHSVIKLIGAPGYVGFSDGSARSGTDS